MSHESAVTFYEKLENDLDLRKKLQDVKNQKELENIVKNEMGYHFTREEMQKVIFERNPEMSDEELEIITGGLSSEQIAEIICGGITLVGLGGVALGGVAAFAAAA